MFSCRSCITLANAISGKSFIFKVMNLPRGMCDLCSLFKPLWITQNCLWFSTDLKIPFCSSSRYKHKDILSLYLYPPVGLFIIFKRHTRHLAHSLKDILFQICCVFNKDAASFSRCKKKKKKRGVITACTALSITQNVRNIIYFQGEV